MAFSEETYCQQFMKKGNKMEIASSGDKEKNILKYIGNNKWNSGYCNALYLNDNRIEIGIKINKLSVAYGCIIGIVSDTIYVNDYFHFNKFDVISYALKSDSSQFCTGKKISKKGKKFKTGDIVTLILENNTIKWHINDKLQCIQKDIDKTAKCWYLGIAMLGKNDNVEIIKFSNSNLKDSNVDKQQTDHKQDK